MTKLHEAETKDQKFVVLEKMLYVSLDNTLSSKKKLKDEVSALNDDLVDTYDL